MSINRWDPFREMMSLREAMNSLFEESVVRPRPGFGSVNGGVPLDVHETEDAFVVTAPLPGVDADDVEISVLGDKLQVSGEFKDQRHEGDGRWLLRERRFGHFARTITLPSAPLADQAQATFDKGVLTIRLPKAEESRAKSIPVRVSASVDAEQ